MSDTTCSTCGWKRDIPCPPQPISTPYDSASRCPDCQQMRPVYRSDGGGSGFMPPIDCPKGRRVCDLDRQVFCAGACQQPTTPEDVEAALVTFGDFTERLARAESLRATYPNGGGSDSWDCAGLAGRFATLRAHIEALMVERDSSDRSLGAAIENLHRVTGDYNRRIADCENERATAESERDTLRERVAKLEAALADAHGLVREYIIDCQSKMPTECAYCRVGSTCYKLRVSREATAALAAADES